MGIVFLKASLVVTFVFISLCIAQALRVEKRQRKRRRQARKIAGAIMRIEDAMKAEFRPVLEDLERQARLKVLQGGRESWDVRRSNELRP